jgi:hypothetical protein
MSGEGEGQPSGPRFGPFQGRGSFTTVLQPSARQKQGMRRTFASANSEDSLHATRAKYFEFLKAEGRTALRIAAVSLRGRSWRVEGPAARFRGIVWDKVTENVARKRSSPQSRAQRARG